MNLTGAGGQHETKDDKDYWNDDLADHTTPVSFVENDAFGCTCSARPHTAGASYQVFTFGLIDLILYLLNYFRHSVTQLKVTEFEIKH